jgi:hypothetical protein
MLRNEATRKSHHHRHHHHRRRRRLPPPLDIHRSISPKEPVLPRSRFIRATRCRVAFTCTSRRSSSVDLLPVARDSSAGKGRWTATDAADSDEKANTPGNFMVRPSLRDSAMLAREHLGVSSNTRLTTRSVFAIFELDHSSFRVRNINSVFRSAANVPYQRQRR